MGHPQAPPAVTTNLAALPGAGVPFDPQQHQQMLQKLLKDSNLPPLSAAQQQQFAQLAPQTTTPAHTPSAAIGASSAGQFDYQAPQTLQQQQQSQLVLQQQFQAQQLALHKRAQAARPQSLSADSDFTPEQRALLQQMQPGSARTSSAASGQSPPKPSQEVQGPWTSCASLKTF